MVLGEWATVISTTQKGDVDMAEDNEEAGVTEWN